MYKYTTPTFTLTLPEGTDLGLASEVVCTLAHDGKEVASKTGDDLVIDGNIVEVYFSQEETKNFPQRNALARRSRRSMSTLISIRR